MRQFTTDDQLREHLSIPGITIHLPESNTPLRPVALCLLESTDPNDTLRVLVVLHQLVAMLTTGVLEQTPVPGFTIEQKEAYLAKTVAELGPIDGSFRSVRVDPRCNPGEPA